MNNILYGYFRVNPDLSHYENNERIKIRNKLGYVCVKLTRPNKGSNSNVYKASFAFCSPLDSFNKKLARSIVDGRSSLSKKGRVNKEISFRLEPDQSKYIRDIFVHALRASEKFSIKTPRWFKIKNAHFGLNNKFDTVDL